MAQRWQRSMLANPDAVATRYAGRTQIFAEQVNRISRFPAGLCTLGLGRGGLMHTGDIASMDAESALSADGRPMVVAEYAVTGGLIR